MPPLASDLSPEAHLEGAAKNLAYAEWLRAQGRTDSLAVGWAITALFYSAVHAVRAYLLARHNVKVTSHDDVKSFERQYPEIRRTVIDYEWLKQESHSARYYLSPHFTWDDYAKLRKAAEKIDNTWRTKTVALRQSN